jgi:hypothetical protein
LELQHLQTTFKPIQVTGLPQEFEEWQPNLIIAPAIADLAPPVLPKPRSSVESPRPRSPRRLIWRWFKWQLRRILAWFTAREEVVRLGKIAIVDEILEGERASMLYNQKRRGMASHFATVVGIKQANWRIYQKRSRKL